ncbi:aminotransferase class III-fold pyridoxal phosphate-dependent enzyme [Amphritea sp. 1_MG-2023]|uniref:aminotransferase family protein n=1 Tax=Amphritea sp. 1_MG-2023 TaxID=3062670 RepID=UPI0026E453BD|nr:aminotransferase class III-fold pyridoxal phosphate-dependent enzyme [Amphritea sp. 1_MG-2023]MDO6565387.1 aminotransferase class III-fold pyridoxal phosphate-dependent enzyme [Amphritea sp. 1_MG-2023]
MKNNSTSQWIEDFEGNNMPETIVSSGCGGWVNIEGNERAYEAVSGHSCLNLGHGHSELIDVVADSLKNLSYCSPEHLSPSSIALSERLSTLLGGNYMVKYSLSGSSSNEIALSIARRRWKALGHANKTVCISLDRSYHGNLGQAQYVTGFEAFRVEGRPDNTDFVHISSARNANTGALFSLTEIQTQIENTVASIGAERIACLFVEPVNFAGGVIVPPKGYLKLLRKLCDQYEITLIVDEVITGFGRSGAWFAFQQEMIRPDIVTMGKGITAGYFPLAAVAVDKRIYDELQHHQVPLKMVITMAGHPVGCSIALKAIEIVERDNLCAQVTSNEQVIRATLNLIADLPIISEIRGFGHMWGLEFCDFNGYSSANIATQVAQDCEHNGCIVAAADGIIRINPPLNMSEDECDHMLKVITDAVNTITANLAAG